MDGRGEERQAWGRNDLAALSLMNGVTYHIRPVTRHAAKTDNRPAGDVQGLSSFVKAWSGQRISKNTMSTLTCPARRRGLVYIYLEPCRTFADRSCHDFTGI